MTETTDRLGLPWNLAEWVAKEQLLEWIVEAAGTLEWDSPEVVDLLRPHPEFRPKMLLTLLTYAYATGVFAAADIVNECLVDETCRAITDGEPPTVEEMVTFRHESRWLVQWLLFELFQRAARAEGRLDDCPWPRALKLRLAEAAKLRVEIAQELDRGPDSSDLLPGSLWPRGFSHGGFFTAQQV